MINNITDLQPNTDSEPIIELPSSESIKMVTKEQAKYIGIGGIDINFVKCSLNDLIKQISLTKNKIILNFSDLDFYILNYFIENNKNYLTHDGCYIEFNYLTLDRYYTNFIREINQLSIHDEAIVKLVLECKNRTTNYCIKKGTSLYDTDNLFDTLKYLTELKEYISTKLNYNNLSEYEDIYTLEFFIKLSPILSKNRFFNVINCFKNIEDCLTKESLFKCESNIYNSISDRNEKKYTMITNTYKLTIEW